MENEKSIEIKLRIEEDKETYCLYTDGLRSYNKPEIEIRKIPSDFIENAKNIIDCVADYVVKNEKIEEGSNILIIDKLHNFEFPIKIIYPMEKAETIQENSLRIIDDYPEDSEIPVSIPSIIAQTYFLEGFKKLEEEKYNEAIEFFNKSLNIKSDLPYVYKFRGEALLNIDKVDKAIEDFNKAIEMGDDDTSIYFNRAIAYAIENQLQKSLKDIDFFINNNVNNPIGYEQRAIIWEMMGKKEEAEKDKSIAAAMRQKT